MLRNFKPVLTRVHPQMVDFGSGQGLSDFETGGIACYFEDFKRAKTPPRAERCRLWMDTNPPQATEPQTMPRDRQGLQVLKCRHVFEQFRGRYTDRGRCRPPPL